MKEVEKKNSRRGKLARASGARFELKVRGELESQGWILDKWTNNVDIETKGLIKARRKYNPFFRALSVGTGFPDFVCFRKKGKLYEIIGVECKSKGLLDREEKEKCRILLGKGIFLKILIARKSKKRGAIDYDNFEDKYLK